MQKVLPLITGEIWLRQGWRWEEGEWRIDRSGAYEDAIDADGWSYAVDFPWLRLPPAPGTGRQRKVWSLLPHLC